MARDFFMTYTRNSNYNNRPGSGNNFNNRFGRNGSQNRGPRPGMRSRGVPKKLDPTLFIKKVNEVYSNEPEQAISTTTFSSFNIVVSAAMLLCQEGCKPVLYT